MIFTNSDGAARGNPGLGAIAVILRKDETILTRYSSKIGNFVTNNVAEYNALIAALKIAAENTKEVTCCIDSELVVNQLLGKYRVKDHKMKELFLEVQKLQEKFDKVIYVHVPREDRFQMLVDELVNLELDTRE